MNVRVRFTGVTDIRLEVPVDVDNNASESEIVAEAVKKCATEGLDGFAADAFTEAEVLW